MLKFLRKHRKLVMVPLVVLIGGGMIFFGVGGGVSSSPQDVIAKINGEKVRQIQFDRIYNQIQKQREDLSPQVLNQEALQVLIRQAVFYQEAKRYGLHVSNKELMMRLAGIPAFQREGKFDPVKYKRTVVQVFGTTLNQFEKSQKIEYTSQKVNQLIASTIHISDDQLNEALVIRLALETDPEIKKALKEDPEKLRNDLRTEEINLVIQDWLNNVNSQLRVNLTDRFQLRLQGAPQQPANNAQG